jgi:hypothetical protein
MVGFKIKDLLTPLFGDYLWQHDSHYAERHTMDHLLIYHCICRRWFNWSGFYHTKNIAC